MRKGSSSLQGFPTTSYTNPAIQSQKMAIGLKCYIYEIEGLFYVGKKKVLISCAVTAQLISCFVFAYAKSWFSHDTAYIVASTLMILNLWTNTTWQTEQAQMTGFLEEQSYQSILCFQFILLLIQPFFVVKILCLNYKALYSKCLTS